jgi:hypothetical protein
MTTECQTRLAVAGEISTAIDLLNEALRAVLAGNFGGATFTLTSGGILISECLERVNELSKSETMKKVSALAASVGMVPGLGFLMLWSQLVA